MRNTGLYFILVALCFAAVQAQMANMFGGGIGGIIASVMSRFMGGGGALGGGSGTGQSAGTGQSRGLDPFIMQQVNSRPISSADLAQMLFNRGTIESPMMMALCQNNFMACMNMMRSGGT